MSDLAYQARASLARLLFVQGKFRSDCYPGLSILRDSEFCCQGGRAYYDPRQSRRFHSAADGFCDATEEANAAPFSVERAVRRPFAVLAPILKIFEH
jgi:hypothetical protein